MDRRSTSLTSHWSAHRAREWGVLGEGTDVLKASWAAAASQAHTEVGDKTGSTGPLGLLTPLFVEIQLQFLFVIWWDCPPSKIEVKNFYGISEETK